MKFPRSLLLVLFLVLARSAFAENRIFNLESLQITFDSDWATQGGPGYFPVRFEITNLGEAREIVLVANQQHWFDLSRAAMRGGSPFRSFDMGGIETQRTIRLKRGDRVKFTVPIPVFADNESFQFRLRENGRPIEGFSASASFQSAQPISESAVLFVTQPSSPLGSGITPRPVPPGPGYYRGMVVPGVSMPPSSSSRAPSLDFFLEPQRLPDNWLGYTTLLGVLLPASEWSQLSPAQKDALMTWTAAGGDLFLADGPIETVLPASQRVVGLTDQNGAPYFLGHIHLVTSENIRQQGWAKTIQDSITLMPISNFTLPVNRARDWGWIAERGFRLVIAGVGQIPTRAYLLILVLFLLLIGPVNYIYLWRRRQQVLLVLTVPLLSLTFMVLLTGYALFLQGLDVRARAITFTVLDQNSKRAATRSSVSLYPGGFMPSGGVQFAPDTAVFPLGTDGIGQRTRMSLDLTDSQKFRSGLLTSRAPSNFDQIRIQPARERLSIERSGNDWRVVNGLGSGIKQLFVRDGERWWTLEKPLATGEQATLTVRKSPTTPNFAAFIKNTAVDANKFQDIALIQHDRTYLALLDSSPFWEPGVAEPKESESFHLVLGYLETQP